MPPMALRLLTGLAWSSAALLALAASGADAPAVFADASSESLASDRGVASRALGQALEQEAPRLRTSRLNFENLRALRQAAKLGRPGRARLNLFEGAEFDWLLERTAATATGYSLSGPLAGVEGGTATLVVNGDVAVGSAWTPEGTYRIRTVGRSQIIERVEPSRAAVCAGPLQARSAVLSDERAQPDSAAEDDGTEIDVLVVYTPQARRRAGGHRALLAEIDHEVAWTNEAFATSDVVHRVQLVGAAEVDYDQSERFRDLDRLHAQSDGHMDEVHALRDRLAADAVVLWTTDGGIAFGWDRPDDSLAFATVGFNPGTFAHELGHVLGIRHQREEDRSNRPFPYSHGYVLRGILDRGVYTYGTIMESGGGNLPRFSNPRQRFRGVPLGVPGEEPTARADGPADAARSMNESRRYLANYRRSATRCGYRLSAPPAEVPAAGGSYTLRVEADAGCPWAVRVADGFTTVTSAASGIGDGTVSYRVPANEGWLREVALVVAGRMHIVAQPGLRPVKPVCERSAQVRELIEAELEAECADIAAADLSRITKLDTESGRDPVQPALGDFDGLSNLGDLRLIVPEGGDLPIGVFDGLTSVTNLAVVGDDMSLRPGSFRGLRNVLWLHISLDGDQHLPRGAFQGMPRTIRMYYSGNRPFAPGAFEGLSDLRHLTLGGAFVRLPAGTFRGLPNLQWLDVHLDIDAPPFTVAPRLLDDLANLQRLELSGLADVPAGLFSGLSMLLELRLQYNAFTSLPPGIFEGLSSLRLLILDNGEPHYDYAPHWHELSTLPPGLFSGLSSLHILRLNNVGLRELRPGAFREVGSTLLYLHLQENELATLDAGTFDGLPELRWLDLAHNRLATLPVGVFDNLPSLWGLEMQGNHLTTLPSGALDNLLGVQFAYMQDNRLTGLPPGVFQNMQSLSNLRLHSNYLTVLPDGLFSFHAEAGWHTRRIREGIRELTLHGNPGAPFVLAFDPVVISPAWQRPVRVAAHVAEGAPITFEVTLDAVGGRLEAESVTMAHGALLSDSVAVQPTGRFPIVVQIAGHPDAPGDPDCAATIDAGRRCTYPAHTGIVLRAGSPLVLNDVSDISEFDEPTEIDLANVFLEFDDSAIPTFSVRSSDPTVATWELTDRMLKLTPTDAGTTTVTVTATARGRTATRTFSLTVPSERRFMRGWRLTLLKDGEEAS